MKTLRFLPLPLVLAAGIFLAGCGGGGTPNVPQDAVAVVGSQTITRAQYNDLISSAKQTFKLRKQTFPKVGTAQYDALKDQAITYLVQESELEQKGKTLGVQVTDKDIQAQIDKIKKQYKWTEAEYRDQLKKSGLTEAQLKRDIRANLLGRRIYNKVTANVTVSKLDVEAYYKEHVQSYQTPASRTVRHILVSSKSLADKLETQLKKGADFAALAKKYSKDTTSAKAGGKLTITKGQTVKPFEDAAFSLKVDQISSPVHSQYGWHIIQALGPVIPQKTTPLKDVESTIRQSLLSQKKSTTMQNWVAALKKEYAKKVAYQTGYAPATTATTASTTVAPTVSVATTTP